MKRRKAWAKQIGARGYRVRLLERGRQGMLYLRWWDPARRGLVWRALGHHDRDLGERQAKALSAELLAASEHRAASQLRLADLFTLYEREVSAHKKGAQPAEDRRRIELWTAFVAGLEVGEARGASLCAADLDLPTLERFVRERRAGSIRITRTTYDAEGRPTVTPAKLATAPSDRTIDADLVFLQAVLNWATTRQVNGRRLLDANPVKGFRCAQRQEPARPVATYDRFLALQAVADQVDPQRLFGAFLALLEALGWRVTALCQVWASDFDRRTSKTAPHGRLRKRGAVDKEGVEQWVPLSADARAALDRAVEQHPAIGDRPIFESPKHAGRPWTRWHARDLLARAEACAELEPIEGGQFHPFRRKWATERKHLPTQDVMHAGGWRDDRSLRKAYQQVDPATLLAVVSEPRKLREAK